jgi:hypothetical protein
MTVDDASFTCLTSADRLDENTCPSSKHRDHSEWEEAREFVLLNKRRTHSTCGHVNRRTDSFVLAWWTVDGTRRKSLDVQQHEQTSNTFACPFVCNCLRRMCQIIGETRSSFVSYRFVEHVFMATMRSDCSLGLCTLPMDWRYWMAQTKAAEWHRISCHASIQYWPSTALECNDPKRNTSIEGNNTKQRMSVARVNGQHWRWTCDSLISINLIDAVRSTVERNEQRSCRLFIIVSDAWPV